MKSATFVADVAQMCHEVNRAYCNALGDHSQVAWRETPLEIRESAIKGVQFLIDNPHADAQAQHQSWMEEKIAGGWVRGEVKDMNARTHPCIVPYEELPQAQRVKDYLFQAVIRTALNITE